MFSLIEIAFIIGLIIVASRAAKCHAAWHGRTAAAGHGGMPLLPMSNIHWHGRRRHHHQAGSPGGPPNWVWIVLAVAGIWWGRRLFPSVVAMPSARTVMMVAAAVMLVSMMRGRRRGAGLVALLAAVVIGATLYGSGGGPRLTIDPDLDGVDIDAIGERIGERFDRFGERMDKLGEEIEQQVEEHVGRSVDKVHRHIDRQRQRVERIRGGIHPHDVWQVTLDIDLHGDELAARDLKAADVAAVVMKTLRLAAAITAPPNSQGNVLDQAVDKRLRRAVGMTTLEDLQVKSLTDVFVVERDGKPVVLGDIARLTKKKKKMRPDEAESAQRLTVQMSLDGKQAVDMNEVALEIERTESALAPSQRSLRDVEADEEDVDFEVDLAVLRSTLPPDEVALAASAAPAQPAEPAAAPAEPAAAAAPAPTGEVAAPAAPAEPSAPTPPTPPAAPTPPTPPTDGPPPQAPSAVAVAPPANPPPLVDQAPPSAPKYPIERSERPEWLDKKPASAQGVFYLVAGDGPYTEPECDREKIRLARAMSAEYFEAFTNLPLETQRVPYELLLAHDVFREYYKEPVQTSFGSMYQVHLLLAFDDRARAMLREQYRQTQVEERLVKVGAGGGLLAALLATLLGYLKLDTATRGYYTRRLTVAAGAVVAGAAALAALAWQGQLGL